MKTILRLLVVAAILAIAFAGCIPVQVRTAIRENRLRCDRFVELVSKGETTREQEQRFIEANGKAWAALDVKYGE